MSMDRYGSIENVSDVRIAIDGFMFGLATALSCMVIAELLGQNVIVVGSLLLLFAVSLDIVYVYFDPNEDFGY